MAKKEAAPEAAETEAAPKSIINSKYRGKYSRENRDWLARFIDTHATKLTEKKVTTVKDDAKVTETKQVPDGVDVDALHDLAETNGLDISALKAQSGSHGYAGRARMTIRNMLQTVAKQRHGLYGNDGKFHSADQDFLTSKNAPEKPTHAQDGTKIEKPKAEKAPAEAAA